MHKNLRVKFLLTSFFLLINIVHTKEITAKKAVSSNFGDNELLMSKTLIDEIAKRGLETKSYLKNEKIAEVVQEKVMVDVPEEYETTQIVELSKGESKIEAQKRTVREQLAKKNGESTALSGTDKIKAALEKNKRALRDQKNNELKDDDDIYALARQNERTLREQNQQMNANLKSWAVEYKKNIESWAKEREAFLKRIDEVKQNLEDSNISETITKEIKVKKTRMTKKEILREKTTSKIIVTQIPQGVHFINGALDVAIKDQSNRPTCSSFAGIRAVEIMLAQNNIQKDLSEQYFYWSSKPKCQTTPCSQQGSWVGWGYDYSIKKSNADIPIESNCPYSSTPMNQNESQIPLSSGCNQGVVKVVDYSYEENIGVIEASLLKNYPVIVSLKLTENFYKNEGMIFQSEIPTTFGSKDSHAGGHSVLLVGVMNLPKSVHAKEGKICFITANSWGVGWGKGGYSCMSQRWLEKNKGTNPFVVLKKVKI